MLILKGQEIEEFYLHSFSGTGLFKFLLEAILETKVQDEMNLSTNDALMQVSLRRN